MKKLAYAKHPEHKDVEIVFEQLGFKQGDHAIIGLIKEPPYILMTSARKGGTYLMSEKELDRRCRFVNEFRLRREDGH